jgi:hypothetical protein
MTKTELLEETSKLQPLFCCGREINDFEELRIGRVFRMDRDYEAVISRESIIFTPLSGWDWHNGGFGSSFMRIKRLDAKIDTIVDLDFLMGVAVIIRLA